MDIQCAPFKPSIEMHITSSVVFSLYIVFFYLESATNIVVSRDTLRTSMVTFASLSFLFLKRLQYIKTIILVNLTLKKYCNINPVGVILTCERSNCTSTCDTQYGIEASEVETTTVCNTGSIKTREACHR